MTKNYIQTGADKLDEALPGLDPDLARLYVLLILAKGGETTRKDVHDAWALWRNTTRPDHPALIEFDELTPEVQELDQKYLTAIWDVDLRLNGWQVLR